MNQDNFLNEWKPGMRKKWLHLLAGAMWSGVGIMLTSLAIGWLRPLNWQLTLLLAGAGVFLALIIYRFGFSKLAAKNRQRIENLTEQKICIFAFQEWKSYPLIAFMIALGIALRSSSIPKPYLAIAYIGIGISLFLASLQYYGLGHWRDVFDGDVDSERVGTGSSRLPRRGKNHKGDRSRS